MGRKKNAYMGVMTPWKTLRKSFTHQDINKQQRLFYFEMGETADISLILIHGLGDEADTWRHTIPALQKNWHAIMPDLPGFGRSRQPRIRYTPTMMMDTLNQFLDIKKIQRAILIGSSLGAILSQGLCLNHPDRFVGMVLVGGALLQATPMNDPGLNLMRIPLVGEYIYTRFRKDPQAAWNSLKPMYYDLEDLPQEDRDFLFKRVNQRVWSNDQRRAYFSTLRHMIPWVKKRQDGLRKALAQLECPSLVIRGDHDPLFPAENALEIKKVQPRVEFETIENAGHLPHQERPDRFNHILLRWLDAHFSG
jgi:pimeloyl-ACP methyl ester carboxylesterase